MTPEDGDDEEEGEIEASTSDVEAGETEPLVRRISSGSISGTSGKKVLF